MATTLVIVELLITGFEVLIWVSLLLWHVGAIPISPLDKLKEPTLLVPFLVGTAYTLGIVWDRFLGHTSTLFQKVIKCPPGNGQHNTKCQDPEAKTLKTPRTSDSDHKDDFYRTEIFKPHAYDAWENTNRQIRLLRATCFSSVITAIVLYIWRDSYCKAPVLVFALLVLGFISGFGWVMSYRMQATSRTELYCAVQRKENKQPPISDNRD